MKKEEKIKLAKKTFKYLFILSFIAYVALYISQSTGYYEYGQGRKSILTEEQIKIFEQDLKDGKEIDIEKYIESTNKDYSNNISEATLTLSEEIGKYTKIGIDTIFSQISKLIEN